MAWVWACVWACVCVTVSLYSEVYYEPSLAGTLARVDCNVPARPPSSHPHLLNLDFALLRGFVMALGPEELCDVSTSDELHEVRRGRALVELDLEWERWLDDVITPGRGEDGCRVSCDLVLQRLEPRHDEDEDGDGYEPASVIATRFSIAQGNTTVCQEMVCLPKKDNVATGRKSSREPSSMEPF